MRPPREEPRRDVPAVKDLPPPRDERRPDDRRDRWRRNDDLGPAVVGFGDDVPAFMTVRRRPSPAPVTETDA